MADSVEAFFESLAERINRTRTQGITATIQFEVTGEGGGAWCVELNDGVPVVRKGRNEAPDLTVTVSAEDWLKIVNDEMSAQSGFVTGRVKLQGDMPLAIKLPSLIRA